MTQDTATNPLDPVILGHCAAEERTFTREMLTRVGDRWTLVVVAQLRDGPARFTELLTRIEGISHRMLTQTLRCLQRDGMLTRTAYAEVPPRVEYALTPLGRTLLEPLAALIQWSNTHREEVAAHRDDFDR
ncbi:HxlR family transcriptional regulator [Cnuibacter physcomitrellae]|uniref:Transcriptional regulator n=1 Tax=Cnuibacter physcomitrellae TaxID=1619308 RepID=A0A1X9LIJ4_9MICO|nr:helix-turn-helix domain-containing protein [Cnuibacter physcomitrellae]ARJ04332.1 transcriptional regulator [Cnuibacter physcomitrellae]GGI40784.1 HxlR family transcriptional regulator [Cnuibacter physcomitrellae]